MRPQVSSWPDFQLYCPEAVRGFSFQPPHSNDMPFDRTSPAIPIGPHWMVLWPFDANHCGLLTTVGDAGAWIMFSGTPYATFTYAVRLGDGNEYVAGDDARWTIQYVKPR